MKTRKKDNIVLLCSHGSRALAHSKNLEAFRKKINNELDYEVTSCYLERNKPSLKESIESNLKIYNKVIIFPFLIFEGIHFINDIKLLIKKFSNKDAKKIVLIKKISLIDEILPLTTKINREILSKKKEVILVTCSSFSKKKTVIIDLEKYTKLLAENLKIKKFFFHFSGDEKNVIKKIKNDFDVKKHSVLFHPLFFFKGYLFQKSSKIFGESFKSDITITSPLMNHIKIYQLILNKLINSI